MAIGVRLRSAQIRGLAVSSLALLSTQLIPGIYSSRSPPDYPQATLGWSSSANNEDVTGTGARAAEDALSLKHEHDKLGAVASESDVCSRIGIDILRAGGNAADSMVATTFCVGVIGMYHSGIGGGGFMVVRSSDGSVEDIDFRETAPAAAFEEMYRNRTEDSVYSGLSSGVPGEVRGLAYLHEKYGVLPWADVVMPAVKVAREGWHVNEDLLRYTASAKMEHMMTTDPEWAIDFAPNGTLLGLGEIITRERYASTLETIARYGPNVFYNGPMALAMINAVRATGGEMTMKDLEEYSVTVREPATIDYRGYKIYSSMSPGSGAVALSAMKIIEGYEDIGQTTTWNSSTHTFVEALRFAYGQRSELGDPDFVAGMSGYQTHMLNASTAASIRRKINPRHTLNISDYDPSGFESLETHGTSAVVTSDATGLTVALTTTINLLFGSRVIVPETGVIMNDEMNDFSIPGRSNAFGYIPSPANYIRPRKRPLSSVCPAIVNNPDGSMYFASSAAGGSRIITAVIQSLWHVLDHNMTVVQAAAEPRLHDQLIPNNCVVEVSFNNGTADFLRSRGHNVTYMKPGLSALALLRRLPNGTFEAAGEPRQANSGGFVI